MVVPKLNPDMADRQSEACRQYISLLRQNTIKECNFACLMPFAMCVLQPLESTAIHTKDILVLH